MLLPYDPLEAILYVFDTHPLTLSPCQLRVLLSVSRHPGIGIAHLTSIIGRDRSTITRAIASLIDIGLIEKVTDHKSPSTYFTSQEGDAFFIDILHRYSARLRQLKSP